jgi:hypothetical protein
MADWIVINAARGGRFECVRCGQHYLPNYPAPVSVVSSISKAFAREHRRCRPHADGDVCPHCARGGHTELACPTIQPSAYRGDPHVWLSGTDTGLSSLTLWAVMMARPIGELTDGRGPSAPLDAADFGRCHRLLKAIPGWRAQLPEMRAVPGWARLVDAWPSLETLYEAGEHARLTKRMFEIAGGKA